MAASSVEEFAKSVESAMAEFDATPTDLPEVPDESKAEELLVVARLLDLG